MSFVPLTQISKCCYFRQLCRFHFTWPSDVDYGFIIGNTITTSWVVTCSESDTVIGSYLDDLEGDAAIEAADAKKLALSLSPLGCTSSSYGSITVG